MLEGSEGSYLVSELMSEAALEAADGDERRGGGCFGVKEAFAVRRWGPSAVLWAPMGGDGAAEELPLAAGR